MKCLTLLLLLIVSAGTLQAARRPSHHPTLSPAEQAAYEKQQIDALTQKLVISSKEIDPFGLSPRGPVIKTLQAVKKNREEQEMEIVDVAAAVRHLTFQAIDPEHQLALDGATGRDILQGDLLVLNYKEKEFRVWVTAILPDMIRFTEYRTGVKINLPVDFVEQDPHVMDETPSRLDALPGVSHD